MGTLTVRQNALFIRCNENKIATEFIITQFLSQLLNSFLLDTIEMLYTIIFIIIHVAALVNLNHMSTPVRTLISFYLRKSVSTASMSCRKMTDYY